MYMQNVKHSRLRSDTVELPWNEDEHQASLEKSSYAIPSTVFPFIRPWRRTKVYISIDALQLGIFQTIRKYIVSWVFIFSIYVNVPSLIGVWQRICAHLCLPGSPLYLYIDHLGSKLAYLGQKKNIKQFIVRSIFKRTKKSIGFIHI